MSWKIIPFIIILFLSVPVFGQSLIDKDIEKLRPELKTVENKPDKRQPIDMKNEIRMIASAVYHFYKAFISSQDANNCAFHPSCSTYTFETLKLNGILGVFDAFDRLTRCNGFSPEKYHTHIDSPHFYDPVKKIR
jgi:putative component of membrane protein insertase Oxa1/YidC/SpoIIIJ protein YidD